MVVTLGRPLPPDGKTVRTSRPLLGVRLDKWMADLKKSAVETRYFVLDHNLLWV